MTTAKPLYSWNMSDSEASARVRRRNYAREASHAVSNALSQVDDNGDLNRAYVVAQCGVTMALLAVNETLNGIRDDLADYFDE